MVKVRRSKIQQHCVSPQNSIKIKSIQNFSVTKVAKKGRKVYTLETLFLPFLLLSEHSAKGKMSMLRPMARSSAFLGKGKVASLGRTAVRMMATQSPDGVNRPTALARLYFEDGTHVTGRSFGCHEAVEGEVRKNICIYTTPGDNSYANGPFPPAFFHV